MTKLLTIDLRSTAPRMLGSRGTPSQLVLYGLKNMCAKFDAFTRFVTIFPLTDRTSNGILVIPFFDIGKWLFVLMSKSHLNNVLRVMFTLRDQRIMRENCYCPRPKKCVYFSYIPQGNLKLGYGLAYSLTKYPS